MAAGIFISYRRDESRHAAGRLADDLAQAFGPESIFRDIEGIEPGLDFTQSLEKALRSCVVMLVLIGPRWLDMRDAQGRRRLDQDGDWIRQEIATALKRDDVRVIPVLLEGAALPEADQLPADMQPLVRRQAFELADGRWRGDLQRLVDALARVPGLQRRPEPAAAPAAAPAAVAAGPAARAKPMLVGAALGVVGLIAVAVWLDSDGGGEAPLEYEPPAAGLPAVSAAPPQGGALQAAEPPDVSGLWRTNTGETYDFEQDGIEVHFVAEAGGQPIGEGRGRFDGSVLKLSMTMTVNGVHLGTANCDMQAAPDHRSFTGMCQGPNGPFPAQFYR